MKTILVHRFGGPEVLKLEDVPTPRPASGQVLVRIHAGLIAGLENGTLRPIVGKELPLAEAARAHKEILEPGAFGKIVLVA